ncbi:MAG TPA: hypothetical protein VKA48_00700, partial [Gammaproteobacteria bacterium]|nr:hypothetical protein [Gammaproteobacteria bacterium]
KADAAWVDVRIRASTLVGTDQVTSEIKKTLPWADGEEPHLPDSPFNAGCPFIATASSSSINLNGDADGDGNPDGTVTITLTQVPGATATVAGRSVVGSTDNSDITSLKGGTTSATGQVTATVEAKQSTGGPATIDFYGSCAHVAVQANW